jgi:hypothetical protein
MNLMPDQQESKFASPTQLADRQPNGQEPSQIQQPAMQPTPPSPAAHSQPAAPPQRIPYWLQQAERLLRVVVRIYIGLIVCVVPWFPTFWDANPLFAHSPWLMDFVANGAVRGFVSGLGLLNLWFALRDALRPYEGPAPR